MLQSYTTTNPRLKQQVQLAVKLTWPTSNFLKKLESNSRYHQPLAAAAAAAAATLLVEVVVVVVVVPPPVVVGCSVDYVLQKGHVGGAVERCLQQPQAPAENSCWHQADGVLIPMSTPQLVSAAANNLQLLCNLAGDRGGWNLSHPVLPQHRLCWPSLLLLLGIAPAGRCRC
jgi:hypothetical protein